MEKENFQGVVIAKVRYEFQLNTRDSEKVREYMDKYGMDGATAIERLCLKGEIDVYFNSKRISFETDQVEWAEEGDDYY